MIELGGRKSWYVYFVTRLAYSVFFISKITFSAFLYLSSLMLAEKAKVEVMMVIALGTAVLYAALRIFLERCSWMAMVLEKRIRFLLLYRLEHRGVFLWVKEGEEKEEG